MKRIYERFLFLLSGVCIACVAYMVVNIVSHVTADDAKDTIQAAKKQGMVGEYETLIVKKFLIVGDPDKDHIRLKNSAEGPIIQFKRGANEYTTIDLGKSKIKVKNKDKAGKKAVNSE